MCKEKMETLKEKFYNALLSVIICLMYSSTSDAACSLPEELQGTLWEYNYTKISDNSEQSTTLNIVTTTIQDSISLNAFGTTLDDWTCINSLNISNAQTVLVFKSDTSFTSNPFGGSRRLYLCMKLTKVTADLFYFYLLSDVFTDVDPDERVFAPEDSSAPNDNEPTCSTFCQYTGSPKIRTLRRQGTNDALPNDASLCEPCGSACDVADKCNPNPCQNNGTCNDLTDSFNCTCALGWLGDNCTTAVTCDYPDTVPHTTNVTSGNGLDDTITLSCSVGYNKNSGDAVLTCKSDSNWEGSPIICLPVTCPNPSAVVSATILVQTGSNYLDTIEYKCNTGYELSSGNLVRTCKEGKHWDGKPPVCNAACSLPEELQGTLWEYNYTKVSDKSEQSTTLNIATTTMQTSISLDIYGTKIDRWTCINSLNISNAHDVVVFKSDKSFISEIFGAIRWLYLCMKLTKVSADLFYFYLLSDVFIGVDPNERVFAPEYGTPNDNEPTCSTFCQYTGSPKIRTLRRQGTNDALPNDASLCEPCGSACDVAVTCDYPDTVPHTTNVTSGNELDDTITLSCSVGYNKNSGDAVLTCKSDGNWEGSPIICLPVTCPNPSAVVSATILVQTGSNYLDTITYKCNTGYEISSGNLVRTCKEDKTWDGNPPVCNAACSLPEELQGTLWEYNYTKVSDKSEQSTTLNIATTTMQTSISLDIYGTKIDRWTCINSLNISNAQDVVVFKSDKSFTSELYGGISWLYLCMKLTKVSADLFYFYLLSDVSIGVDPNERVFAPEYSAPNDNEPTCSNFCQYTGSPKIRTLRRQGTNDALPNDASLCEPCGSACDVAVTCDYPDTVPHTTNVTSGNGLDDTITLSCSVGYNKNSGDAVLTCKSDGNWEGSPIICLPVTCPNPSAVVSATILVQTGSNYLDTITYKCNTGYELSSGNLVRTCKEGKTWDGNPPVCTKVTCSSPSAVAFATISVQTGSKYLDTITYTCNTGYELASGNLVRICKADKIWNDSPVCSKVTCPNPSAASFASVSVQTGSKYLDTITYTCNTGYELASGNLVRKCKEGKNWDGSPPLCTKVTCPSLAPVVFTTIYSQTGAKYLDTLTYTCNTGFELTSGNLVRTCKENKNWSGKPPVCTITCPDPGVSDHVTRQLKGNNPTETVVYNCDSGYDYFSGDETRVCGNNGQWSGGKLVCKAYPAMSNEQSNSIIAGTISGVFLILAIIVICLYCCCIVRKQKK
ncbi:sushi, von Willebrand factor type A, EGF and pentraxin domain-containing protein 1-like isoform X2 [Mytilus californianus]|uniref:sushi, von Willebrand factor type A, EGF and pentraxin domain-containing protein 1-like isoform X2 n=2 Tax=Mytilus californianus TaxID=6549 RepID=UPI002246F336|nr:sushi, von Willebrand factor type A, EGF and pentraxin domain-containing protein 1-like isoform X2 [Mytilus californianus]